MVISNRTFIVRALALTLVVCASVSSVARDLALVVNKASAVKMLTSAELNKLASAAEPKWPGGGKITVIMRDPGTPAMSIALEKFFDTTSEKAKSIIAANPTYFVIVKSDAEVIRMVEGLPGAVGLIDIYSITSNVNVLKINGKLPLEQGYALHGN